MFLEFSPEFSSCKLDYEIQLNVEYLMHDGEISIHLIIDSNILRYVLIKIGGTLFKLTYPAARGLTFNWSVIGFILVSQSCFERNNSYNFFLANQRKVNTKNYSWTQYDLNVNGCDWHILVGNDERIVLHCLTENSDWTFEKFSHRQPL